MSAVHHIDRALTRKIPLIGGGEALVDFEDFYWLKLFCWRLVANGEHRYAWGAIPAAKRRLPMHRIILDAPPTMVVDHINGDGLDNRRANLRLCTHAQNMKNMRPGKQKLKGVRYNRERQQWEARLTTRKLRKHLGYFDTEEQACIAYNEYAKEHLGEFAWLNPVAVKATRSPGRHPKPWYRKDGGAWYAQVKGKQYLLAHGVDAFEVAKQELNRIMQRMTMART